jgi:hypothetical protein
MTDKKISRSLFAIISALFICALVVSCKTPRPGIAPVQVSKWVTINIKTKAPLNEKDIAEKVQRVTRALRLQLDSLNKRNNTKWELGVAFKVIDFGAYQVVEVAYYISEGPGSGTTTPRPCPKPGPVKEAEPDVVDVICPEYAY